MITFDTSAFAKSLDKSIDHVLLGALTGVHDATDDLLDKARNEAPLEEGTLRMTAFSDVKRNGDEVEGEVVFSAVNESTKGERANYALILHEMERFKNPTTPGTRPKYLERPLKANAKRYSRMIAAAVRRELK